MTAIKQALNDLKLIITTDHRVWAAAGFICIVSLVWVATGSWRERAPDGAESMLPMKIKPEKMYDMVKGMSTQLREAKQEHDYLRDMMNRMSNEIQVDKEQIDWHANTLITRLNDVSEKVDKVANLVGDSAVDKANLEERLRKQRLKQKQPRANPDGQY